jgi:lysozyme
MQISAAGVSLLKESEGYRNKVYLDTAGEATIGYGHKLVAGESFPNGIDEVQASSLLLGDLRTAERCVERLVKVPLTQGQFDALVDFVFNLGAGRFASSTLLKDLNAGRYDDAAEELLQWNRVGNEVSPALKARREAEAKLWQAGSAEKTATAG